MKRASILFLALFWSVIAWTGDLQYRVSGSVVSQSYAQDCPDSEAPGSLAKILDTPELFIGCHMRIEGLLESGDNAGYSLLTALGRSLDVRSWAPLGKDDSPYPSKVPEGIKPMSYFVGRQLRLVGQLVEEKGGGAVLEVSSVEELGERAE